MGISSITSDGKRVVLNQLKQDLDSASSNYYLGLSGADSSSAGLFNQTQARNEMHFLKKVSGNSFVVETYNWTSGQVYNAYNSNDITQEKFYVANANNEVFLCVETAKNSSGVVQGSTIEPTSARARSYDSLQRSFATGDGYIWRYLYKLTGAAVNRFKSNDFMPVKKITGSAGSIEAQEQQNLQNNSIGGEIIGIEIDSGGNGYLFTPRIDISGNGSGAAFSCTLDDGVIVKITVDSDATASNGHRLTHGTGYDYATVVPSAGNASLKPIFAPKNGVTRDPIVTLRSDKLMVQTTIQGDENNSIPLADPANDFKQVALIRNPLEHDSVGKYKGFAGNAMHYFTVSGGSGNFTADEIFENTSQVRGKTYWHDTTNNYLYYVQNDSTGFGEFVPTQTISSTTTSTSKVIDAINNPTIDRYSGDIMYINNLDDAISRSSSQSEDFRVVIDLGND
jgi:hypothetical protein